jgi:hypothetical protein
MTRRPLLAVVAAIWLASIGLSVIDIRQIDRQRRMERPGAPAAEEESSPLAAAEESVAAPPESPSVLEMPPVTIEAPRQGVTEMQGRAPARAPRPDDLLIGPGVVTHPVAIPHDTPVTPPPSR